MISITALATIKLKVSELKFKKKCVAVYTFILNIFFDMFSPRIVVKKRQ